MRRKSSLRMAACWIALCVGVLSCQSSDKRSPPAGLPDKLPFVFERPANGEPLSTEEIASFTDTMASFFSAVDYFKFLYGYCHGLDASVDPTGRGYKVWWQDVVMVKQGSTVTMRHFGGSDNQT